MPTSPPRTIRLLGEPRDVGIARAFLRRAFEEHGIDGVSDDAVAVVSELVTNAIVHGRGPVDLVLSMGSDAVEVAVTDTDPASRIIRLDVDDEAEDGRGLAIVDALAHEWTVERYPGRKTVRAVVPVVVLPRIGAGGRRLT